MRKMKKILNKTGNIIAIMLMIMPIVIIVSNDKIGNYWWILLVFSICYDFYMYSNILKSEYIEEIEKRYNKYIKPNKVLNVDISDKEHLNIYEKFIEEIINDLKN